MNVRVNEIYAYTSERRENESCCVSSRMNCRCAHAYKNTHTHTLNSIHVQQNQTYTLPANVTKR